MHPFNAIKTILDDHQNLKFDYPYQEIYLIRLLQATTDNLMGHLQNTFEQYQLNDIRYLILFAVEGKYEQGIQPSVLSDMFNISRVQTTRHIDVLEKQGWITRKNNPEDRRSQYVILTNEGKQFLKNVLPPIQHQLIEAWKVIDNEERESLNRILTKLLNHITQGQLESTE